jgi:hypothetical protein
MRRINFVQAEADYGIRQKKCRFLTILIYGGSNSINV